MSDAGRNLWLNAKAQLQSYGTAARTTTGFVVDRVKYEAATGISVAPGTMGAAFDDKRLESETCIAATVTASTFTSGGTIRQRINLGGVMGRQTIRITVFAHGPAGGSFQIAFSGGGITRKFKTLPTYGTSATSGLDLPTIDFLDTTFNFLSTTYITAECFANPADMDGTYKIAFVQVDTRPPGAPARELDFFRPYSEEARLCSRFVYACPNWMRGRGAAGQTFVVPISTPFPMRAVPSVVTGASSVSVVQVDNSANVFTSAAPSPGFDATPNRDDRGGRVVLAAFTSPSNIVAGTEYMLTTPRAFLLEAELG